MKNHFLLLIFLTAVTFFLGACNKDDDNTDSENWAAAVAGNYAGTTITAWPDTLASTTIITRVSDKLINLQITLPVGYSPVCIDSVVMNSSSTMVIAGLTDKCWGATNTVAGSGTFSGNTVNYNLNYSGPPITVIYTTTATK